MSPHRTASRAWSLDDFVEVAKALGHQGRLRILAMLSQGELCVCQITAVVGLSGSTVSAHLSDLRRADLVTEEKRGKWVYYRFTEDASLGGLVRDALHLVAGDPRFGEDRRVIEALRSVPVDDLCRAGLDLVAVGVRTAPKRNRPKGRGHRHVD